MRSSPPTLSNPHATRTRMRGSVRDLLRNAPVDHTDDLDDLLARARQARLAPRAAPEPPPDGEEPTPPEGADQALLVDLFGHLC